MAFDSSRVETITVDSYGTLVDPAAAERALAAHTDHPAVLADRWRAKYLSYVMIVDAVDDYRPFDELIEAGLEQVLGAHGVATTAAERADIMAVYDSLDPYADVRDGLTALATEYDIFILSMGTPSMLDALLEHADIGDVVEDAISVDEIRRYKPHAEVYRHAAGRTGTPIDEMVHVAGPSFDVRGAMAAGMQGVWIDRRGEPWEPCFPPPDLQIEQFHGLVDALVD